MAEQSGARIPARTAPGRDETASVPKAQEAEVAHGGVDTISDAELRVAHLAVDGNSNREIARELFVTVSTVEQHLTRIYRKLGIKRRTDLAVAIRTTRPVPTAP